ncbi:MAG TPA: XRE family transcriptional regulator [Solirubrobacteraceae bacterium]|nr:XRE family transcriptional regulator [Solirubrobacteraceae bacterium]
MARSKTTDGAGPDGPTAGAATAGTPVSRALGANVRGLRLERALSVVELAARSGIARATLTQLESGRGNPTIETIAALAAVLGTDAERLLRHEPAPAVLVVRDGEGSRTSDIATLIDCHPHDGGRTEVFDLTLAPGTRERSTSHGPGSGEVVLVRSGRLRVGPINATVELTAGDYATFSADCLHEYLAPREESARFWLVVRYASTRPRPRR